MRTVTVTFPFSTNYGSRTKEYEYYIPEGDEPRQGDLVLTSTRESCARDGSEWRPTCDVLADVSLARVERINPTNGPLAGKFYLHLISMMAVERQRLVNRESYTRLKKAADLLAQMRAIVANDDELTRFKTIARSNLELRKLLKAYEQVA